MPEAINPKDRRTVRYLPSGPKACSLWFDDIECETNTRPYLNGFAAACAEEFVFGLGMTSFVDMDGRLLSHFLHFFSVRVA